MKYKTILFDLDGTLLNTIDDLKDSINYILKTYNYPEHTLDEVKQFVGRGIPYMVSCALPEGTDNPLYPKVLEDFKAYYNLHCQDKTGPYPGILELIKGLKDRGVQLAVVTNKLQGPAEELIHTMFPGIDLVIGDQPGIERKPSPDGCYLALQKLGAKKEETAYVGDSNIDFETAQNAGLPCLSVLWGFRTKEQLLTCGATNFFETPSDLLKELLQ